MLKKKTKEKETRPPSRLVITTIRSAMKATKVMRKKKKKVHDVEIKRDDR